MKNNCKVCGMEIDVCEYCYPICEVCDEILTYNDDVDLKINIPCIDGDGWVIKWTGT